MFRGPSGFDILNPMDNDFASNCQFGFNFDAPDLPDDENDELGLSKNLNRGFYDMNDFNQNEQ